MMFVGFPLFKKIGAKFCVELRFLTTEVCLNNKTRFLRDPWPWVTRRPCRRLLEVMCSAERPLAVIQSQPSWLLWEKRHQEKERRMDKTKSYKSQTTWTRYCRKKTKFHPLKLDCRAQKLVSITQQLIIGLVHQVYSFLSSWCNEWIFTNVTDKNHRVCHCTATTTDTLHTI
jgi:hypothetical protein